MSRAAENAEDAFALAIIIATFIALWFALGPAHPGWERGAEVHPIEWSRT
jgi:hypothetical protein